MRTKTISLCFPFDSFLIFELIKKLFYLSGKAFCSHFAQYGLLSLLKALSCSISVNRYKPIYTQQIMIFGLFCSFAVWAGSACAFSFRILGPCWHNSECIYVLTTGFFKSCFSCRGRPWHNPHYVDCKKQMAKSLKPSHQITQKHKGL